MANVAEHNVFPKIFFTTCCNNAIVKGDSGTWSITETGGGTLEPLLALEGGRGNEEKPEAEANDTRADIFYDL